MNNSWDKITGSYAANALQIGYMDMKCSLKEYSIAGCEKWGPVILWEMVFGPEFGFGEL